MNRRSDLKKDSRKIVIAVLAAAVVVLMAALPGSSSGASRAPAVKAMEAPSQITVIDATATTLTIAWSRPSDSTLLRGYIVYRNGSRIGTTRQLRYRLSRLRCGVSYLVAVSAVGRDGRPSAKASAIVPTLPCPDTQPPTTPSALTVVAKSRATISVRWGASTDDTGVVAYDITRDGREVASSTLAAFTFDGLACGAWYSLGVEAVDASGNHSAPMTALAATSPCPDTTPPPVPADLHTQGSTLKSISIAWAAIGSDAVGFTVYLHGTQVGNTTANSFTVADLSCGSSYTLALDAYDAAGNHSKTASVTGSTSPCPAAPASPPPPSSPPPSSPPPPSPTDTTVPSAPSGLTITAATTSSISASWPAASDNIGVTGYRLFLGGAAIGTTAQLTYTFQSLLCGHAYTLGVEAYDAAGNNSARTSVTGSTSPCPTAPASPPPSPPPPPADTTAPSAPSGLSITAATTSNISVSWPAASDSVGVTGYRLFLDGAAVGTTAQLTYTFQSLVCGHAYSLGVVAYDAAGNNSARTSVQATTSSCSDTQPPSAPTGLNESFIAETSFTLSWSPATDNAGVAGYGVYVTGLKIAQTASTSYALTGLSCGTTYTVGVDAYDAAGNRSTVVTYTGSTASCPDTTAPSTPTGLTTGNVAQTSIGLSWAASTDNVGVTGYDVTRNGTTITSVTGTSTTFTGLSCGTSYTLGAKAFDAAGNRSALATKVINTSACSDTTPPSTPAGLATSSVGQTSLTLSWSAASDNVGVTGYRLYQGGSQVGTASGASYGFSGLACGASYTLGVAAVDGAGNVSGTATLGAATTACSASSQFAGTFDCYGSTPNCSGSSGATCTSTISSGLAAAINAASAGAVICLNTAGYGAISISSKSFASDVIVQPMPGATATLGRISAASVNHLRFSGTGGTMNVGGTSVSGASSYLTFDHLVYTACVNLQQSSANSLVFDHDRFDNLGGNGAPGCPDEGRVQVLGGSGASIRLTISNSHFGGQGPGGTCSDGIQLEGDGVQVGPGNEFTGMAQSVCSDGTHSDPIQIVGASNEVITGNWFHDNGDGSGGCMCHDFNPDNVTFTNNVFASTGYAYSILSGEGADNWTIRHNVFVRTVKMDYNSPNGTGNVIRDNVWVSGAGGAVDSGSGVSYDHNLSSGKTGTGNVSGTQVFVSSPSSGYYHYQLDSTSPGYHAASDGKSMGISP